MTKEQFVWIRKKGDTTGATRKQVGSWAAQPQFKSSLPEGYELENPEDAIKYAPTSDPSAELKKRKGKDAVVIKPADIPNGDESVLELVNPLTLEDDAQTKEAEEANETKVVENDAELAEAAETKPEPKKRGRKPKQ